MHHDASAGLQRIPERAGGDTICQGIPACREVQLTDLDVQEGIEFCASTWEELGGNGIKSRIHGECVSC